MWSFMYHGWLNSETINFDLKSCKFPLLHSLVFNWKTNQRNLSEILKDFLPFFLCFHKECTVLTSTHKTRLSLIEDDPEEKILKGCNQDFWF